MFLFYEDRFPLETIDLDRLSSLQPSLEASINIVLLRSLATDL